MIMANTTVDDNLQFLHQSTMTGGPHSFLENVLEQSLNQAQVSYQLFELPVLPLQLFQPANFSYTRPAYFFQR